MIRTDIDTLYLHNTNPNPIPNPNRLSKSIDMRFHWLQDRIQRGQFRVQHVAGVVKVADFFTKALPHIKHAQFAPYCALDPQDNTKGMDA